MLVILVVVAAAFLLAAAGYFALGWRQHLVPLAFRALAWASMGLLLVNPGCREAGAPERPLVLLDASLSMTAAGGRWDEALDSARQWGEVRPFGDPERALDTIPDAGTTRLAEALEAARATGRPVVVVTDGEVEDAAWLGAVGQPSVRLFPRAVSAGVALTRVEAPARITGRDTLRVRASVRAVGIGSRRLPVSLSLDGRELARATAEFGGDGETEVTLQVLPGLIPVGDRVLQIAVADTVDAETRDNARSLLLVVTELPGVVLLAAPGDWDARFLLRSLGGVTDLPVEGYVQLERNAWRRMADLAPVGEAAVREAAAGADLLVVRGTPPVGALRAGRGVLELPGSAPGDRPGDWYLSEGSGGPIPGSLAGLPLDSFPPATAVALLPPGDPPAWVGLIAQLGRRGTPRPALAGYQEPRGRRVVLLADGLWRWAFRGGSSEQAYRALVASTVDWLLAVPEAARGAARPVRPVVARGRPVVFSRAPSDTARSLPVRLQREDGAVAEDTLRFGADGQGVLRVEPGSYRYALADGAEGRFIVETWSAEWFPGPITLQQHEAAAQPRGGVRGLREAWWLYALGILAFCGEWVVRRRRGLK
ncbi:MAG TPA: hypothetical protein VF862_06945 [Gemmatimonadales bacterium]